MHIHAHPHTHTQETLFIYIYKDVAVFIGCNGSPAYSGV